MFLLMGLKKGARARIRVVISSFFNDYASVHIQTQSVSHKGVPFVEKVLWLTLSLDLRQILNGQIGMPETLVS